MYRFPVEQRQAPCTQCGALKFDHELIGIDHSKSGPAMFAKAHCRRTSACAIRRGERSHLRDDVRRNIARAEQLTQSLITE